MPIRLRLLATAAILASFACPLAFARSPADSAARRTVAVSGVVTVDGRAAAGVPVWATPASEPSERVATETDAAGRFRFDVPHEGNYLFSAFKAGYYAPADRLEGNYFAPAGLVVTVVDGQVPESVEIPLRKGGVISGKITDGSGHALPEISVRVLTVGDDGDRKPVNLPMADRLETDDRGVYRAYGLPPGDYFVAIRPDDDEKDRFPQTFFTGVPSTGEARTVAVATAAEVDGVDIVVLSHKPDERFVVSGRVLDADTGEPVAGVSVRLERTDAGDYDYDDKFLSADEATDASGAFRVRGVKRGAYVARAHRPCGDDCTYRAGSIEVAVDADVDGLAIRSPEGTRLDGRVELEGVSDPAVAARLRDVRVKAVSYDDDYDASLRAILDKGAPVGADGSFRILGLWSGAHTLELSVPDGAPPFRLLRVEGGRGETPKTVEIEDGRDLSGVRLVVGIGTCSIRGRIRAVNGALPPTQKVYMSAWREEAGDSDYFSVDPDVRREFALDGLLPGRYELSAHVANGRATRQVVTLGENGATADVTLTIDLSAVDPDPDDADDVDDEDERR